jgi:hypothetical protein
MAVLVCGFSSGAKAQLTVTENRTLDFGTIVTRNLASVAEVTVSHTGVTTGNANAIVLEQGQSAEYIVEGGPASTVFTVTIDSDTDVSQGGTTFTLDNFTTSPGLQTNGAGEATFQMGARASSLGGGVPYPDGNYSGTYDFTVDF